MWNPVKIIEVNLNGLDERYRKALYSEMFVNTQDHKICTISMLDTVGLLKAIVRVHACFSDSEYVEYNTNLLIKSNFDVLFERICDDLKYIDKQEYITFMQCVSPKIQALIKLS